jgi:3-hydroxyacyl-CoA dehydrogenase
MENTLVAPHSSLKTPRRIRRCVVLGSGVMGSRIACHFANAGLQVLLLDILPMGVEAEQLTSKQARNSVAQKALHVAIKATPAPLYLAEYASRIEIGNLEDDLARVAEADWIIEVVIERLDIKQELLEKVDALRKPGTLITSNTSGIPIHLMAQGRSDDFCRHFCGTHFFNPPRYLPLLEIIPTEQTEASVTEFLMNYGARVLGKTTVLARDTPAFIANRVGVFAIMDVMAIMAHLELRIEDVDKLTGPVIGHPKSATFRTSDVVGLDTLIKVADGLAKGVPADERNDAFNLPAYLRQMEQNKWLGDKTGQGFYKKSGTGASKEILSLNLATLEYGVQVKTKFGTLESTKAVDDLSKRWPLLVAGSDKAGQFYRAMLGGLLSYAACRVGDITDAPYRIDDALRAGFGWEQGPFETWDALGLEEGIRLIKEAGRTLPEWVDKMRGNGSSTFYRHQGTDRLGYAPETGHYQVMAGREGAINLVNLHHGNKVILENSGATLYDLGDGVCGLEFHTKMNTLGAEVVELMTRSIAKAEKEFAGMVIGSQATNFSAGANLATLFMYAVEEEWDEVDFMIRQFQQMVMRVRYSGVPVVVAPYGLTLGGGCEMTMHADKVQAAAETYIGLVEVGVGLIPAGGGTKEMALRISDGFEAGDPETNALMNTFMNLATAKVATSASEAFGMRILKAGDRISINGVRQLADAKASVLELAAMGYNQPAERRDIRVLGKSGLGTLLAGIEGMKVGRYASEHDAKVATKLAYVICGGDLSYPQRISEQYLLDMEREAFLSLCGERKTLERIQAVLQQGRPVRN